MPTQKDVANAAGVTSTTVSLILNGRAEEKHIQPSTVARVLKAMNDLGYQPNMNARRLRNSDFNKPIIALYWPSDSRIQISGTFISWLQKAFADLSYDCELVVQTYQKDFLKNTVSPFMRGNYSGVIIGGCSSADLEFLHTLTPFVPIVLIDRTSEQYSTVGVDNRLAGVSVAELIKKAGHSSVAVIRSENSHIGQTPRFNAFLQACRNMEITIRESCILQEENNVNGGAKGAERYCALPGRPAMLVCETDNLALGSLVIFRQKGLRIPEDVQLLCFGFASNDNLAYQVPPVSTVTMPTPAICRITADLLRTALEDGNRTPVHRLADIDIHLRESFRI